MPLYEYQCEADGSRFEVIQKFSDPPVTTCPTCGGAVKKLLSSPAIQFKGTGWYITDYARKDAKNSGSDKSSGKASDSSASTASTSSGSTSSPTATPATPAGSSTPGSSGSSS